jgi:hypothetical protein
MLIRHTEYVSNVPLFRGYGVHWPLFVRLLMGLWFKFLDGDKAWKKIAREKVKTIIA